jgi:hypothetical protein
MNPDTVERATLRDIIANDAYAATFQSFGQYRAALLKHIDTAAQPTAPTHSTGTTP